MRINTSIHTRCAYEYIYIYIYANRTDGEKAWRQLQKNAASNFEQVLEATPHKEAAVRPPTTHHENYQS